MFANSFPDHKQQQQQQVAASRLMANLHQPSQSVTSQQNSLYAAFDTNRQPCEDSHRKSHLVDLAKLQQANLFESAVAGPQYDENLSSSSSSNATAGRPLIGSSQMVRPAGRQPQNDGSSFYSPSSSTSLLYHIYDQINLPGDQAQHAPEHQLVQEAKANKSTTILNPANLFGASQHPHQMHQQPMSMAMAAPVPVPMQHYYATSNQNSHQYQPTTTMTSSQSSYLGGPMMLDTVLRQQHQARQQQQRPLSTGSSMSSGLLTYGRPTAAARQHQLNQVSQLNQLSPHQLNSSLATELQSKVNGGGHHTLAAHLRLSASGTDLSATSGRTHPNASNSVIQGKSSLSSSVAPTPMSPLFTGGRWSKRASQGLRHFIYEYRTIMKCSFLLILLAFTLMSLIKFTLLSSSSSTASSTTTNLQLAGQNSVTRLGTASSNQHQVQPASSTAQQTNNQLLAYLSSGDQNQIGAGTSTSTSSNNPSQANSQLVYPFNLFSKGEQQPEPSHTPAGDCRYPPCEPEPTRADPALTEPLALPPAAGPSSSEQPDMLTSKLLIGEFVVLSQNYTHSGAQKSLLAERIVKLMDQIFLSTEVQSLYSRTEVTNIRPNRPVGIIVDCNIVLSRSIQYAAQQFGIALYDSLTRSHERLANQPSYIIDKNSIRLNTVPDKDLKSGIVPLGLLSAAVSRELGGQSTVEPPPSSGLAQPDSTNVQEAVEQVNSVVWSEWSQWSSCLDKNGVCDSSKLHSRLRWCISQHTGERVDTNQCKQRFNQQDQAFEVADCSCAASSAPEPAGVLGPQTAPSVLLSSEPAAVFGPQLGQLEAAKQQMSDSAAFSTTERAQPASSTSNEILATSTLASSTSTLTSTLVPALEPQLAAMSCSNCTSDEICLLLVQQKVPFCAKLKDRADKSGCGGWCNQVNQLCQPVGPNAFKCIHDSECLAEEWRCHDSACVPLSKRCDGHSNCYDSSDERDCPAPGLDLHR